VWRRGGRRLLGLGGTPTLAARERASIGRRTGQEEDGGGSPWQWVVGEAAASAQQWYPSTVNGGGGGGALVGSAGELHGSLLQLRVEEGLEAAVHGEGAAVASTAVLDCGGRAPVVLVGSSVVLED
jgi:hypothetical protein